MGGGQPGLPGGDGSAPRRESELEAMQRQRIGSSDPNRVHEPDGNSAVLPPRDLLRIPSCAFRPAALKLHRACAGPSQPRPSSRWSSCHSAPGAISSPQRTQVAYPLRTTSSTRGRTVLYTRPYRRNAPYAATQRDRPPGRDTERGQLPLLCLKRHGYRVCGVLYCLESPDADYLADVGSADEGRPVGGGFPRRRPGGRGWTPASV